MMTLVLIGEFLIGQHDPCDSSLSLRMPELSAQLRLCCGVGFLVIVGHGETINLEELEENWKNEPTLLRLLAMD